MEVRAYSHEAELMLAKGTDPAAVGAMVTVALCGHWEHKGPCRWPHFNQIDGTCFKTTFVATPEDEPEVRGRIREALLKHPDWRVISDAACVVAPEDVDLAAKLLQAPRQSE